MATRPRPSLRPPSGAPPPPAPPPDAPPGPFDRAVHLRRIMGNAAALLLAYGLPRIFTVGAVILAARVLGAESFGLYGTAAAFAVVLSIVATLGMMPLLIRDIAREPRRARTLLRSAHRIKTFANALMLALLLLVAELLGFPPQVFTAALLLGIAYAVGAYVENLAAFFQAVEKMHVWSQASAAYGLVTGGLGAVLVVSTRSIAWFCVAPIAGQLAALAWLRYKARAELPRGPAPEDDGAAPLLRALPPFAAAFLALTLYYKLDVLLLARWSSASEVGIYTAVYKLWDVAQALSIVAVSAVFPRLARAAPLGREGESWAGGRVAELVLLGGIPAAGTLWILREPVVSLLFGAAYDAGAPVLALLAPALAPLAVNIFAGYLLGASGRMGWVAAAYAAGAVVNVGLNTVLIPASGAAGAAAAKLASETLLAVGLVVVLHRRAAASVEARPLAAALGAAALAPLFALAPDPTGGVLVAGAYAAAVAVLYWQARALKPEERQALHLALRGRAGRRQLAADDGGGPA